MFCAERMPMSAVLSVDKQSFDLTRHFWPILVKAHPAQQLKCRNCRCSCNIYTCSTCDLLGFEYIFAYFYSKTQSLISKMDFAHWPCLDANFSVSVSQKCGLWEMCSVAYVLSGHVSARKGTFSGNVRLGQNMFRSYSAYDDFKTADTLMRFSVVVCFSDSTFRLQCTRSG